MTEDEALAEVERLRKQRAEKREVRQKRWFRVISDGAEPQRTIVLGPDGQDLSSAITGIEINISPGQLNRITIHGIVEEVDVGAEGMRLILTPTAPLLQIDKKSDGDLPG